MRIIFEQEPVVLADGHPAVVTFQGIDLPAQTPNSLQIDVHINPVLGAPPMEVPLEIVGAQARIRFMRATGRNATLPQTGATIVGTLAPSQTPMRTASMPDSHVQFPNMASLHFPIDPYVIRAIDQAVTLDFGLPYEIHTTLHVGMSRGVQPLWVGCRGTISGEAWRELRPRLGLGRRWLFEIPQSSFVDGKASNDAERLLAEAQLDLSSGRPPDCARKARMVVDSVLRSIGYVSNDKAKRVEHSAVAKGLREAGVGDDVASAIEQILRGFSIFTASASHPDTFKWEWAEAEFALHTAAALASFVGRLPARVRDTQPTG